MEESPGMNMFTNVPRSAEEVFPRTLPSDPKWRPGDF